MGLMCINGLTQLLFLFTISLWNRPKVVFGYSCKNLVGKSVDWFIAYKFPKVDEVHNNALSEGAYFVYADADNLPWQFSKQRIDDPNSAIGRTITQIFGAKRSNKDFYALYNDEHPSGKMDAYRGHTKGVLVFDDIEGFWMVHSVPLFPSTVNGSYNYPFTGYRYGQSFLCMTISSSSLDDMGRQLHYNQPSVYEHFISSEFARLYPNLKDMVNGKSLPRRSNQYYSIKNFTTTHGAQFTSFAKHKKFGKDVYASLVAPTLRTSLYVETWLNGPNDELSECDTDNKVFNVRTVNVLKNDFTSSKDHSKWAVSTKIATSWVCIGDINRQKSQKNRGGGTVCMYNPVIWQLYQDIVQKIECCPTSNQSHSRFKQKLGTPKQCY